jgi:hypothetical protein
MAFLSLNNVETLTGVETHRFGNRVAFSDVDGWVSIQPDGSEERRVEGGVYNGSIWNELGSYELAEDLGNGFCIWRTGRKAFLRKFVE